jgi:hypothetical protein
MSDATTQLANRASVAVVVFACAMQLLSLELLILNPEGRELDSRMILGMIYSVFWFVVLVSLGWKCKSCRWMRATLIVLGMHFVGIAVGCYVMFTTKMDFPFFVDVTMFVASFVWLFAFLNTWCLWQAVRESKRTMEPGT